MNLELEGEKDIVRFELLFHQMQPRLYAYCRKYIDDEELARDFVQESFINLWKNSAQINEASHKSYLFTTVRNRCLSHFRSLKVQAEYEDLVALSIKEVEIHPTINDPLIELYTKEINEIIQHSIEKLPEKCRLVFEMSRLQGMKNQEIADELNINIRTVEAHIYSALKILKADLKDYLPLFLLFFLNNIK